MIAAEPLTRPLDENASGWRYETNWTFPDPFISIVALLVDALLFSRVVIPIGFTWRKELNRNDLMRPSRFSEGNSFSSFSIRFLFASCVCRANSF